jgi:hypothetical protein
MTLTSYIGAQKNLLQETPEHCRVIKMLRPVLFDRDLARIRAWQNPDFKTVTLDATFDIAGGRKAFAARVHDLCAEAEAEFDRGCAILVLSDRAMNAGRAPLPSLLACAAVHHHLIRAKKRTRVGLAVETAEAREVMHFALLFGYGADAIIPGGPGDR